MSFDNRVINYLEQLYLKVNVHYEMWLLASRIGLPFKYSVSLNYPPNSTFEKWAKTRVKRRIILVYNVDFSHTN